MTVARIIEPAPTPGALLPQCGGRVAPGFPGESQCMNRGIYEIDGVVYCRNHAGTTALKLLLGSQPK